MKQDFIKPRLVGQRFVGHTLPIEFARDLAAYEALVFDLAKELYLRDHPNRKRLPKGFDNGLQLHLQGLEEGSTKPVLCLLAFAANAALLPLGEFNNPPYADYLFRARDLVSRTISENQLPEEFPRDLLCHFNKFGATLKSDESIELPTNSHPHALLTPQKRRDLVLLAEDEYEDEVEIGGFVEAADWGTQTFRLNYAGETLKGLHFTKDFGKVIGDFGGKERHWVSLSCTVVKNRQNKIINVKETHSIEYQKNYKIINRIDELAQLKDGWLDGSGKGIAPETIEHIRTYLEEYPVELPIPLIAPTEKGGILCEWHQEGLPSLEISADGRAGDFHAFLPPDDEDFEQNFKLLSGNDWDNLYIELCKFFNS